MIYKLDTHTHSIASPDGGLTEADYKELIGSGVLDVIAVTDHNTIEFAQYLSQQPGLSRAIIVGEEISTSEGHLVGLYLTEKIEEGLPATTAADRIHDQGGLVYVPHINGGKRRSSLGFAVADAMVEKIDILEAYNSREFWFWIGSGALKYAEEHGLVTANGSDAHGRPGMGRTYNAIDGIPQNAEDLMRLLKDSLQTEGRRTIGLSGQLQPSVNRLKKIISH